MIDAGIDREDLHRVVRAMQTLFTLLYLLDDLGSLEEDVADLSWRLVRVDEDDQVVGDIGMLHESVLDTDPASRG